MSSLSIQFIVEDGSKVTDANSYVTITEFKQYWINRGVDYNNNPSENDIKILLTRATAYCDSRYRFSGEPTYEDQSLQWPRNGLLDSKGRDILYNEIPDELKYAVCEIAKYIYDNGQESLDDTSEGVASKSIGPVSITYGSSSNQVVDVKTATRWLKNFINPKTTTWRV